MKKEFYDMIFKRKSFHLFRNITGTISESELDGIKKVYETLVSLCPEIKTWIKIVPSSQTNCKKGEYCILLCSEKKENYLQNIGYIGEQLDLYLVSQGIGTLWYGFGKSEEDGYTIMMAIAKVNEFRKDMFKSKRKAVEETWKGTLLDGVSNIARFAPSACNSQPWLIERQENKLSVYRFKKQGVTGIRPAVLYSYFNQIDMGIYLCFLELCLEHNEIEFKRELFVDGGQNKEKSLNATYQL